MQPLSSLAQPLDAMEITQLLTWRRALHAQPELALCEHDTQTFLRAALQEMGCQVEVVGGTGLKVVLGQGDGPALLLRADMDALPIQEHSGLPFASQRAGCMHACGHDAHMAVLLAVTRRLKAHEQALPLKIVLCFQPAEENGRGALALIQDGVLDQPKVGAALGLHVWTGLPTGTISAAPGGVMAAVGEFILTVRGRGGHGAMPHTAVDPVVAAAAVVQALQGIASRRTDPLDPVVVTVGSIHGGSAFNIIADEVVLHGTCRSFSPELAERLPGLIEVIASAAAASHGATIDCVYNRHTIVLHNDEAMSDLVAGAAAATPGVSHVDRTLRMMGGEDMAYYLERVPGCFFFVGCGPADGQPEPHHSPRFVIDEAALPLGVGVMLRAVAAYGAA